MANGFFSDLIDTVTGIAKRVADFEIGKRTMEFQLASQAQAAEAAANAERVSAQAYAQQTFNQLMPILVIGGLGLAGVIVFKRLT